MTVQDQVSWLLATGAIPSAHELALVRQEIAIRTETIARYRRETERLESECEAFRTLLAPLRRITIPFEILGEIFLHALSARDAKEYPAQLETISLVCKTWRNAALVTPHLWVHLDLQEVDHLISIDKITLWLSRSGALPKTLHLGADDVGGICPLRTPALATFLAQGPVFKELSLGCTSMHCLLALLESVHKKRSADLPLSWDLLSQLHLDGQYDWGGETIRSPCSVVPPAHLPASLKSLTLELPFHDDVRGAELLEPLVLPGLSELNLGLTDWPIPWLMKTLKGCCNLRTLSIDFMQLGVKYDGADNIQNPNHAAVALNQIETLRLRRLLSRQFGGQDTRVLRLLQCPNLAELDVSFWNEMESDEDILEDRDMLKFAEDVGEFVQQSKCAESGRLKRFRLHSLVISSLGLVEVFRSLPSVVHLTLDDIDVETYLCERLIKSRGSLLPCLETVEFLSFRPNFDCFSFCQFIESRLYPYLFIPSDSRMDVTHTRIKRATISLTQQPILRDDPNDSCIKKLRDRGVDLTVKLQ